MARVRRVVDPPSNPPEPSSEVSLPQPLPKRPASRQDPPQTLPVARKSRKLHSAKAARSSKSSSLLPQLFFLTGFIATLFIMLCLAGFQGGIFGDWLAHTIYSSVGYGGWGMAAVSIWMGLKLARREVGGWYRWFLMGIGWFFLLPALEMSLSPQPDFSPGGWLGAEMVTIFSTIAGRFGAALLVATGLVSVATLLFRIDWQPMAEAVIGNLERHGPAVARKLGAASVRFVRVGVKGAGKLGTAISEKRAELKEQARLKKELEEEELEEEELEEDAELEEDVEKKGEYFTSPKAGMEQPYEPTEVASRALVEVQWEATQGAVRRPKRLPEIPDPTLPFEQTPPKEALPRPLESRKSEPQHQEPSPEPEQAIEQIRKPTREPTREQARPLVMPGNLKSGGRTDDGRALRQDALFELPPLSLLDDHPPSIAGDDESQLQELGKRVTQKLQTYGVEGRVVAIRPGPVITLFEYEPAPGVKLSKIASLTDDLKMALEALSVRIVAPIPGRGVVGVEIPNRNRQLVWARDVFAAKEFRQSGHTLPMILGKDTEGRPFVTDLARMPHLLVGGTTGSGKSVGINTMLCSLLFTRTPAELRLILIDPKMLEFELYQDIPHLLHPVVTEAKLASAVLKWACVEMDERYRLLARWQTRNIENFNQRVQKELAHWSPEKCGQFGLEEGTLPKPLPYIVVVIDELADLMMIAARDVEESIVRIAQKARAAGIHLIVATQRPSVDVITGLIKANMPSRLAYQVRSKTDGRTILDQNGAETLLGKGDLLFLPPGTSALLRIHGPFLSDEEVRRVAAFLKEQGSPEYAPPVEVEDSGGEGASEEELDETYDQAVAIAIELGKISTSMIQRRMKIGYNRAARLMEIMEREGIVGPADGARPREVLIGKA